MALTRTKEMDLRSAEYQVVQALNGGTALVAGEVLEHEETAGFTLVDVPANEQFSLITKADQVRAKKASVAITAGDALYWLNASSVVTNVVTLDRIGTAIEPALVGDADVLMDLDMIGKNII